MTVDGLHFFGTTIQFNNSSNSSIKNCHFEYPSFSTRAIRRKNNDGSKYALTDVTSINGNGSSNFTVINNTFEYIEGECLSLSEALILLKTIYLDTCSIHVPI